MGATKNTPPVGGRFEIDTPKGRARCTHCGAVHEGELADLLKFTGSHRCAAPAAKAGAQ